jgi:hypothetical protein
MNRSHVVNRNDVHRSDRFRCGRSGKPSRDPANVDDEK